jgi:nitrogen fixation/metabolism regulation signal transduction histidine kinase
LEIFSLFKYADATNRDLVKLLESIKYDDFTARFNNDNMGDSFNELTNALREVMQKFLSVRTEKEESTRYLQTVIQHVGVGLISYDQLGEVEFINNAAKKLLRLNNLKNISSLKAKHNDLFEGLQKIRAGNKIIVKINVETDIFKTFVYATEFKMHDQNYKLIALQNIQNELEEQEMQAWQKLIKVLTHEIMNSITPISSLASTLYKILPELKKDNTNVNQELFDDISSAVNTIRKRSDGLLSFVENYRSLTKIPKPKISIVSVAQLLTRIKQLMDSALTNNRIAFVTSINPKNLEILADSDLIEQVLINLLKNSIHSLYKKENGRIDIFASIDERGRAVIKVSDNGVGIREDLIDKVFIPFFSSKQDGSGIGLSLSRQIIKAHGGNIHVTSQPDKETIFTIRL